METESPTDAERPYLIIGSVVASSFLVGFGGGVIFPIIPNLGVILGISPFMVGLILSANRFTRLFANVPAGILVDRFGTRKPFVYGLIIETGATFGYVLALESAAPEAWFLGARIVWGIGSALVFATAYTIAADVSPADSRGSSMGLIRGGSVFGFPSGLVLGGIVSDVFGIAEAFLVAAGFAVVASALAFITVPETHVESGVRRSVKPWDIDTSPATVTVGLVNFTIFFAYLGALFASLVLFLDVIEVRVFGFDAQGSSGIFMAITVVSAAIFMILGGYISDRQRSRMPTLLAFIGITFIGFVLLTVANSLVTLTMACLLIGAGQGGLSGPLIALLADLTPIERMGRATGTNNILGDIGGGLGPVITLPLIDVVGFAPVYAVCAILPLLAGVILMGGVYRETGEISPTTMDIGEVGPPDIE